MIKKQVGLRIRQIRNDKKLSQEKAAFNAGIDRTYWASVELGRRNISIINLEKICISFGISLENFFNSNIFKGE